MNIGIISDIHGDLAALEVALDRLDNAHRVDYILCAGDLVGRGPDPDSVVQVIRERGIPTVLGNHDEWNYNLSAENKTFLKSLPIDWEGEFAGRNVFMCHGKPGNNIWGLYRNHVSETYLNIMLASLEANVLVVGHTHVPMYMRVSRGCVVNPGSLYTFDNLRPSSHTYGVLHLRDYTFDLFDLTTSPAVPVGL